MPSFPAGRALALLALIPLLMAALLVRVVWLETKARAPILEKAERQQSSRQVLPARRGSIYDSTGQLLAGSIQVQSLFIDTQLMIDTYGPDKSIQMEKDLQTLGELVEVDGFDILQKVGEKYPDRFIEIARDLNPQTVDAVNKLKLPGVGFTPHDVRIYPMGSLAAHILGEVGTKSDGVEGVELVANDVLTGRDGVQKSYKDARRNNIGTDLEDYIPPTHGRHVVLTIDANIQLWLETELEHSVKQFEATGGQAVVLNPKTGEIVALANYPTFSPQFGGEAPASIRRNAALVEPYEPGSTIKPYIVSSALETGVVHLDDILQLDGPKWKTSYGRVITDVHAFKELAVWDVLVKSSNIGMSQIGEKLGNERLRAAVAGFGFGSPAQSDLRGDTASAGLLKKLKSWTKASPESISQGYELLVTPIQMARAMSAIANDGELLEPHVIKGVLNDDGSIGTLDGKPNVPIGVQVVSPDTARLVRRVLADVPVRGTAQHARSGIYNIFGKTGTAHRAVNGIYDTKHYTASFVGGAPYENPRLVIAFVIRDPNPQIEHYGGLVAAPGAARVLERSLQYLDVAPSPNLPMPPPQIAEKLDELDPRDYEKPAMASGR